MRGKKTDSKTKKEIIEKKLNNPDLSSRDIEKALGWIVSNDTVCDVIKDDLPQVATESQRIANLIDTNNNLQSLADAMIALKIKSGEESIKLSELVSLRDSTFKQNQLVKWSATENIWIISISAIIQDIQWIKQK